MSVKEAAIFLILVLSLMLLAAPVAAAQQDEWPATVGGKTIVSVNGAPAIEGEMIIRYDNGTPDSRKDEILESLGATLLHRFTLIDADAVELAPGASVASALPAVESIPGVRYTQANGISRPAAVGAKDGDPLLRFQFTDQLTRVPLALKAAGKIEKSHPVVAVLDTGVDYTHPDLKDSMWINDAEKNGAAGVDDDGNGWIDDIYGIDACNVDGDPMDDYGHGTFVAGIIAATADNGEGIAPDDLDHLTGRCGPAGYVLKIDRVRADGQAGYRGTAALPVAAINPPLGPGSNGLRRRNRYLKRADLLVIRPANIGQNTIFYLYSLVARRRPANYRPVFHRM